MEISRNNSATNEKFNGNLDKRNDNVLSDADRELLLQVAETYIRIQAGQFKERRS